MPYKAYAADAAARLSFLYHFLTIRYRICANLALAAVKFVQPFVLAYAPKPLAAPTIDSSTKENTMKTILRFLAVAAFTFAAFGSVHAQTDRELGEATIKALQLFQRQQFVEA